MSESPASLIAVPIPLRRRDQLKRVIAGKSITQASIEAGYKNVKSGSNALADTRRRLIAAMEHYGLTPEAYTRDYLLPLLNATQTQYFAKDGIVTDERTDPDNAIILATVRETGKLMGLYPKEQSDGPAQLNIQISNTNVNE